MPENLWKLRARKGYSVTQLASKSGVPQQLLYEYEQGKPLKPADQARLARALYVQPQDIALVSTPPAAPSDTSHRFTTQTGNSTSAPDNFVRRSPSGPMRSGPAKSRGRSEAERNGPARESQLQHLQAMARSRGHSLEQWLDTLSKPLETLTMSEASKWNLYYRDLPKVPKIKAEPGHAGGVSQRRASLPEGLDKFEYDYLTHAQQAQSVLTLTLFNEERMTGQLIGFGLYTFTLRLTDGQEATLQKLAIAYYTRQTAQGASQA